jgi:tRNA1(Val) A37 N6-methylase TrmN6
MSRQDLREKMEAMQQSRKQGVQIAVAPTLYPTPDHVAEMVADYLELFRGCTVLEPSAGTGQLIKVIRERMNSARIVAVELAHGLAQILHQMPVRTLNVGTVIHCDDFLAREWRPTGTNPGTKFDRVAMNPPFNNQADVKHIRHAVEQLADGGILVAICADGPRQEKAFPESEGWEWLERLPSGTFAGTNVRTALIRWSKPRE